MKLDPVFFKISNQSFLLQIFIAGGMWSDDAIKRFEVLSQCAQWSVLMARQVGYQVTANEKVPSLVLVDTNHDEVR